MIRVRRGLRYCFALLLLSGVGLTAAASMPAMRIEASAQAPDGTIVVAGQSTAADPTKTILVGRMNADGTIATTFGSGGWASYADPSPTTASFAVSAIAVNPSGAIVVAAKRDGQVVLLGFTASGQLDAGFGDLGVASETLWNAGEQINALRFENDGSLLAVGSVTGSPNVPSPTPMLVHYSPTGIRDTSFGSGWPYGESILSFGSADSMLRAIAPAAAPDTGFYAVGYARYYAADKATLLVKFLDDGSIDTGFAYNGIVQDLMYGMDDEAFGVTTDSQGGILVVGRDGHTYGSQAQSHFLIARFLSSGSLDPYFGFGGRLWSNDVLNIAAFDGDSTALAAFPQASGLIDVLGTTVENSTGRSHFAIWQFSTYVWFQLGPVATPVDAADDLMTAAFTAPNGQLLAVGTRESSSGDSGLRVRYFADDGTFDTDFAVEGADDVANPFGFESQVGATAGEELIRTFRVSGINVPVAISITGGQYSFDDCQTYAAGPGTVTNGQRVCLRALAATTPNTTTNVEVDVGSVAGIFSITTGDVPDTVIYSPLPANPSGPAVSFYFGAVGNAARFECSLDAAPFAACPSVSPVQYAGLADGAHTFQARAVNSWGPDPTPASYSWTAQVAPDTTITGSPGSVSTTSGATFTFTSNNPNATFQCKVDAAAFTACTSGQAFSGLADGSHTFTVQAVAPSGSVDPTPAAYTWTVDAVPPDTSITSFVPGGTSTKVANASFTFQSTDPQVTGFECSLDGAAFVACPSPVSYASLAEGAHSFAVRAKSPGQVDPTPATRSWSVDTTAPDATITSGSAYGNPTAYFEFSTSDPTATFQCKVDSGTPFGCFLHAFVSASPDGVHTFSVQATDAAGNTSPWVSRQWIVDTVAPDLTITSGPFDQVAANSVTFAFGSTDSTATFECGLDTSTLTACTSPITYSGLAEGRHTFLIMALDPASNATTLARGWTVDTIAPDTTITSGTSGTVASTSASFTFSSNEANASFRCQLDGGEILGCVSPMNYSFLAQGPHTFQVRAVDAAGNVDATPASAAWNVDTIPPETTITGGPQSITQSSDATFTLASNESGVSFLCRLDGGAWNGCGASGAVYHNVLPGQHTFDAQATDAAGNVDPTPASLAWTVDYNYGPDTSITAAPSGTVNQTQATFSFQSGTAGTTFRCAWDGGPTVACTSPFTISGLADGGHAFSVAAVDAYGNVDKSPAAVSWTVDTVSPDTSIVSAPSGTVAQASATVAFASNDPSASFECRLDGGAFAACTTPASLTGLPDGTHTFDVRAKDFAGNLDASPASATWTVDTTAPNTAISSGPAANTNQTGASFAFSSGETGDTYQCSLDGAAFTPCTSPVTYAGLAAGAHGFQVRATDAVGNVDPSPATWNWTIDLTPPDTSITSGPSGRNNASTATFGFTATEANSTFECKLDAGSFLACASTKTYSGLASGSHTFQVRAIDPAGNVDASPASRSWSVK